MFAVVVDRLPLKHSKNLNVYEIKLSLNDCSMIILDGIRCRQDKAFTVVSQVEGDAGENVVSASRLFSPSG